MLVLLLVVPALADPPLRPTAVFPPLPVPAWLRHPDWRIVDADGRVVTESCGPWAIDPRPFARILGRVAELDRATATDPECHPTPDHSCWSAMELWFELVDYRTERCRVDP
jgi:hypothetical protein